MAGDGVMDWVQRFIALVTLLAGSFAGPTERAPEGAAQDTRAIPVQVYFSRRPEADENWTAVFPVQRYAPDLRVATFALNSLVAGPTRDEQAMGYFSELGGMLTGPSHCYGQDFRVSIADGLATVQFCRDVTSAGVGQDARTRVQIEATLLQFPTVQRVRLLTLDGHCLFDQSGQDLCLTR
jgi:hypothetical protein